MNNPVVIVPARLGSQRFPRKLLHLVNGRPLILWTAQNLARAVPDWPIFFAVAEEELAVVLRAEGYEVLLTDPELPSGTDRLAAANEKIGAEWILNAQADEPLLQARHLRQLWNLLRRGTEMATLATPFRTVEEFQDPNKVKVVLACGEAGPHEEKDCSSGKALYFSRAAVPFPRDEPTSLPAHAFWHLGLYGYSANLLAAFTRWPLGPLEKVEKLEQLRVLEHGYEIAVGITGTRTIGVDVPADVVHLEAALSEA